jgi:hypothetical protein
MDVYSLRRHRRDLSEIALMYLLVVGFFLIGLVVWEVAQFRGNSWEGARLETNRSSLHYGRYAEAAAQKEVAP